MMTLGCLLEERRFWMPDGGTNNSGLAVTNWRVLPLDLRLSLSFGGRGGRCLEELRERTESFSIGGGGGVLDFGESTAVPSGKRGRSVTLIEASAVLVLNIGGEKWSYGLEDFVFLGGLAFQAHRLLRQHRARSTLVDYWQR